MKVRSVLDMILETRVKQLEGPVTNDTVTEEYCQKQWKFRKYEG